MKPKVGINNSIFKNKSRQCSKDQNSITDQMILELPSLSPFVLMPSSSETNAWMTSPN